MYTHGHAHRLAQIYTCSNHTNTNRTNSLIPLLSPAEQDGCLLVGAVFIDT